MSSGEKNKNINIWLRWFEKNPDVAIKALSKIAQVRTETVKTGDVNAEMTSIVKKEDDQIGKLGMRLSWFGYRMTAMGRLIMKAGIAPIQQMTGLLQGWGASMQDVATALAFQEAGIIDTGLSTEELRKTLMNLPTAGMQVEGAMAGMNAALAGIAIEAGPSLISILQSLVSILDAVGTEFIVSFVEGIASAMKFAAGFSELVGPELTGFLGKLFAALVILSPILIAVGTALFFAMAATIALPAGVAALVTSFGWLIGMFVVAIAFGEDLVAVFAAIGKAVMDPVGSLRAFFGIGQSGTEGSGVRGYGDPGGNTTGVNGTGGGNRTEIYSPVYIDRVESNVDIREANRYNNEYQSKQASQRGWNGE